MRPPRVSITSARPSPDTRRPKLGGLLGHRGRAAGLALGYAADRLLGDPTRHHPVAAFGRLATALETRLHADSRMWGAAHTALLVGGTAALGVTAERLARDRPVAGALLTGAATWAVLGGTSLARAATAVEASLAAGDLPSARQRLTHLVGRDPSGLGAAEIRRAVVESVAENTSDAVVAPLAWGAVAGAPGLLAYRAANTLDAMVGHRSERYRRFGWVPARLDDLVNLPGSRLTGLLTVAAAPAVGGRRDGALTGWRRDAGRHPSPNAGVAEASFAGALGVRLGGPTPYPYGTEERPRLGDGPLPGFGDVRRAVRLAGWVSHGAAAVAVGAAVVLGPEARRRLIR